MMAWLRGPSCKVPPIPPWELDLAKFFQNKEWLMCPTSQNERGSATHVRHEIEADKAWSNDKGLDVQDTDRHH